MIVDGVFLLRPELDDLWTARVFVDVGEEESVRRGVQRDGPGVEALYRARYLPGQRLYRERASPRERADVVVVYDDPPGPRRVVGGGERHPGALSDA